MKREQTYKPSLDFLESRRQQIMSLSNGSEGAIKTFKLVIDRITGGDHLGVIVALHNDSCLERILKILQYQYQQKKNEEIQKCIAILYLYAYDCFLKFHPVYKPYFDFFRTRIEKLVDKRNYTAYGKQDQRCEAMQKLLKRFEECNDQEKQPFERGKNLNEFVIELEREEPATCFEECVYTYLRMKVEEAHGGIVRKLEKQEIGLCCNLHFQQNGYLRHVETLTQNFSKERPSRYPKEEIDQKDTIRRQVVSYLNSTGGIVYLGIEHNSQKEARTLGIPLGDKDRVSVLEFVLNEIVMRIYPSQDENQEEDEKTEESRLEKFRLDRQKDFSKKDASFNQEYQINRYISVDFIPLYSKQTWFYSRTANGQNINYVVRIKVKLGDEYEVYHIINQKEIPEAYFRENNKERKLTMIEYYNEVYRRLKDKANERTSDRPKVHPLCRFSNKAKTVIANPS